MTSNHRHSLLGRHNEHDGVSNHRRFDCLLNRLFRRRSKKTSKLRVTGLCEGNSPVTGEFPAQRASDAENVFIWWRHHVRLTGKNTLKICITGSLLGSSTGDGIPLTKGQYAETISMTWHHPDVHRMWITKVLKSLKSWRPTRKFHSCTRSFSKFG